MQNTAPNRAMTQSEQERLKSLTTAHRLATLAAVTAGLLALAIIWTARGAVSLADCLPALAGLNVVVVASAAIMVYARRQLGRGEPPRGPEQPGRGLRRRSAAPDRRISLFA